MGEKGMVQTQSNKRLVRIRHAVLVARNGGEKWSKRNRLVETASGKRLVENAPSKKPRGKCLGENLFITL